MRFTFGLGDRAIGHVLSCNLARYLYDCRNTIIRIILAEFIANALVEHVKKWYRHGSRQCPDQFGNLVFILYGE